MRNLFSGSSFLHRRVTRRMARGAHRRVTRSALSGAPRSATCLAHPNAPCSALSYLAIALLVVTLALTLALATAAASFAFTIGADQQYRYIKDEADLISSEEEAMLETKLEEINQRLQFDVVVVTVGNTGVLSTTEYADKYYEDNGYGYGPNRDGVLLLISYDDGRWATTTAGYGITALTDYGLDQIEEELVDNLNRGEFYKAFDEFASRCDEYVSSAKAGNIIDVGNRPKGPFPWASRGLIAIFAGLMSGFVGTSTAKAQLKSVRPQSRAGSYVVKDSFQLNRGASRDTYLYSNVSRIPRQSSSGGSKPGGSTTHVSFGGMTHGGHSGSFKK